MTWRPTPEAIQRVEREDKLRDLDLAVRIMELAVRHCGNHGLASPKELTDVAEWLWIWLQSETPAVGIDWPHPDGAPGALK